MKQGAVGLSSIRSCYELACNKLFCFLMIFHTLPYEKQRGFERKNTKNINQIGPVE